jgi:hypothetical protein
MIAPPFRQVQQRYEKAKFFRVRSIYLSSHETARTRFRYPPYVPQDSAALRYSPPLWSVSWRECHELVRGFIVAVACIIFCLSNLVRKALVSAFGDGKKSCVTYGF